MSAHSPNEFKCHKLKTVSNKPIFSIWAKMNACISVSGFVHITSGNLCRFIPLWLWSGFHLLKSFSNFSVACKAKENNECNLSFW